MTHTRYGGKRCCCSRENVASKKLAGGNANLTRLRHGGNEGVGIGSAGPFPGTSRWNAAKMRCMRRIVLPDIVGSGDLRKLL